jgi:hypothetical protein
MSAGRSGIRKFQPGRIVAGAEQPFSRRIEVERPGLVVLGVLTLGLVRLELLYIKG